MNKNEEWQQKQVAHIEGLKRRSPEQKFFLAMAELSTRTDQQESQFKAVCDALKAKEVARAKAGAWRRLQRDDEAKSRAAARKKRTHNLIQSALMLIAADLVDDKTGSLNIDPDEMVGALLGIKNLPRHHEKRQEWRNKGKPVRDAYLKREAEKNKPKAKPQTKDSEGNGNKSDSEASRGDNSGSTSNHQAQGHQQYTRPVRTL